VALAVAGVMIGAVAVAAFPGIGSGIGNLAIASAPHATPAPTRAPATPTATEPPTTAPTKPPRTPTPAPTVDAVTAAADLCEPIFGFSCGLDPGRYGPSRFVPAVSFQLGDGWSTEQQSADRVALGRNEGRLTLLSDVTRIYPKGSEVAVTGSLRKVIGRIATTTATTASKVRGLTIDGHPGFSVDLTTSDPNGVPIMGVGEETYYLRPLATTRIVLLDLGRRTLAIAIEPTGGASLRDILSTADAVAGSVRVQ